MKKNLQTAVLLHDAYWAIDPQAARQILSQLGQTDAASHKEEYEASRTARAAGAEYREGKPYTMYGSTAIIEVSGPMTKKGSSFGSGGTIEARQLLRKATADGDVKSICIVWDSPGGSVSGTEDLASDIAAAGRKKTVCSFIEDTCCSAALWGAVQAGSVYANSTAIIGSIGVFSYAIDMSRYAENLGIEVHLLTTGKYKGAGAVEGVPISAEQLAEMQRIVDTLAGHFFEAIARGRGMSMDAVEEIADGRVWVGQEAVEAGLIDGVSTLDDVLLSLQKTGASARKASAEDTSDALATREAINDFATGTQPLTGVRLEQSLDSVLTAVEGLTAATSVAATRVAQIKEIRASQHRKFSSATLATARETLEQVQQAAMGFERLLAECEALDDTRTAQAAPPTPQTTDPDAIARLREVTGRSKALLAQ